MSVYIQIYMSHTEKEMPSIGEQSTAICLVSHIVPDNMES